MPDLRSFRVTHELVFEILPLGSLSKFAASRFPKTLPGTKDMALFKYPPALCSGLTQACRLHSASSKPCNRTASQLMTTCDLIHDVSRWTQRLPIRLLHANRPLAFCRFLLRPQNCRLPQCPVLYGWPRVEPASHRSNQDLDSHTERGNGRSSSRFGMDTCGTFAGTRLLREVTQYSHTHGSLLILSLSSLSQNWLSQVSSRLGPIISTAD